MYIDEHNSPSFYQSVVFRVSTASTSELKALLSQPILESSI